MAYCALLARFMPRAERIRRIVLIGSVAILGSFLVELTMLVLVGGPVMGRAIVGPLFYPVHLVPFFLGIPALANLLFFAGRQPSWAKRLLIAGCCAGFALPLVFVQYVVSEALYGTSEQPGPYSDPPAKGPVIIFSPRRGPGK